MLYFKLMINKINGNEGNYLYLYLLKDLIQGSFHLWFHMTHPQNNIFEYLINYHSYDKMQLNVCSQVSVNKLIGITSTIWISI